MVGSPGLAHQFRLAETKARRHDLARRLRAAVEDEAPTQELRQQFEAMRYTPPVAKLYLVNDTTVEKLGELLNHHSQRAAPVSGRVERVAPHDGPAGA